MSYGPECGLSLQEPVWTSESKTHKTLWAPMTAPLEFYLSDSLTVNRQQLCTYNLGFPIRSWFPGRFLLWQVVTLYLPAFVSSFGCCSLSCDLTSLMNQRRAVDFLVCLLSFLFCFNLLLGWIDDFQAPNVLD